MSSAAAVETTGRRGLSLTTPLIVWTVTAVGLVVRLARFVEAGPRTGIAGYDDGVYFGGSLRLVHGSLPYRDFVFVHPPVITELMAPIAAFAPHVGTATLMFVGRIVTALVGTATIPLLGRLLRHRGRLPVAVGCGVVALHASGIQSTRAVLIEPYLALFVVLGLVLLFDGDHPAGRRRTFWAGVVLGVALATKIWAIVPVVVVLALFVRDRQRLWRLASGAVTGFVVPCLPFLIASPGAFYRDVVVAQVFRHSPRSGEISRVSYLLGLAGLRGIPAVLTVLAAAVVVVGLVVGYGRLWHRRRPYPVELVAVAVFVLTVGMFFYTDVFFWHYGGYVPPLLGLVVALPMTGLDWTVPRVQWAAAAAVVVAGAVFVYSAAANTDERYWSTPPVAAIQRALPPLACIITDNVAAAIAVDRLSTSSHCPVVVDPLGTGIVFGHGRVGPRATDVPRVQQVWRRVLPKADALLLRRASLRFIPWRQLVRRVAAAHFVETRIGEYLIFVRR